MAGETSYIGFPTDSRRDHSSEGRIQSTSAGKYTNKVLMSRDGSHFEILNGPEKQFIVAKIAELFAHVFPVTIHLKDTLPEEYRKLKIDNGDPESLFVGVSHNLNSFQYQGDRFLFEVELLLLGVLLRDDNHSWQINADAGYFYDFDEALLFSDLNNGELPESECTQIKNLVDGYKEYCAGIVEFGGIYDDSMVKKRLEGFINQINTPDFEERLIAIIKKSGYVVSGDEQRIQELALGLLTGLKLRAEYMQKLLPEPVSVRFAKENPIKALLSKYHFKRWL